MQSWFKSVVQEHRFGNYVFEEYLYVMTISKCRIKDISFKTKSTDTMSKRMCVCVLILTYPL